MVSEKCRSITYANLILEYWEDRVSLKPIQPQVGKVVRNSVGTIFFVAGLSSEGNVRLYHLATGEARRVEPEDFHEGEYTVITIRSIYKPKHSELYTCFNCESWWYCPWAWDEYNTDGDCLALK